MTAIGQEIKNDVRGCQERSFLRYVRKFAPAKLLEDSGFANVWREKVWREMIMSVYH